MPTERRILWSSRIAERKPRERQRNSKSFHRAFAWKLKQLINDQKWQNVKTIVQFHRFLKHINFLNSVSLVSCLLAGGAERWHRHAGRQQRPHPGSHLPDGTDLPHHRGQTHRHLMTRWPNRCFLFECQVSNSISLHLSLTSGERSAAERTAGQPFRRPGGHLGGAEAGAGGADHQAAGRQTQTPSIAHPPAERRPGGRGDAGGVSHPVDGGATDAFVHTGGWRPCFTFNYLCVRMFGGGLVGQEDYAKTNERNLDVGLAQSRWIQEYFVAFSTFSLNGMYFYWVLAKVFHSTVQSFIAKWQ